jgi:Domain of unknown function (DUF4286)
VLVYNITIKVDMDIVSDWLQWQKEVHIPEIMSTGCFTGYQLYRLLEQDESDGTTYITQYFSETEENYLRYIRDFAPGLRDKAIKKWGDRFVGFRSLMKGV